MTTITCKIPEQLDTELEALAEKRGVSKSQVVREAIKANLEVQKRRSALSAHDVLKESCGIIKGGPKDRSWNSRRLEGFGHD